MAISILNNITALNAANQLNQTNKAYQNTLSQMSSGSKINSGADDAAGLAIANGLQANSTALQQSVQNASAGIGKLQVADGALSQVTSLLNRAVTLATESANGTVSDGAQREALDNEFNSIKAEIDQIGQSTTYNGSAVFSGGGANYGQVKFSSSTSGQGLGLSTAITGDILLKIGTGGATTVEYGASGTNGTTDATVGDLINDINAHTSTDGFVAGLDSSGNLVITDTMNRGVSTTTNLADNTSTIKFGSDSAADLAVQTTNASTMSVYLSDSTQVGSSHIDVALNAFDSSNMNGISLAGTNLTSATSAQSALTAINNAIAQVAALRGNIGAGINRLQAASNVMTTQNTNVSSAESDIMSADMTQVTSNMTKYNVLSQTGIAALSQANQMQQLVLKLLQ